MFGLTLLGTGAALIALETLVTSAQNSSSGAAQVASLFGVPARLASAWIDPTRPLIPDKSGGKLTAAAASSAPPASSTAPATLTSVA